MNTTLYGLINEDSPSLRKEVRAFAFNKMVEILEMCSEPLVDYYFRPDGLASLDFVLQQNQTRYDDITYQLNFDGEKPHHAIEKLVGDAHNKLVIEFGKDVKDRKQCYVSLTMNGSIAFMFFISEEEYPSTHAVIEVDVDESNILLHCINDSTLGVFYNTQDGVSYTLGNNGEEFPEEEYFQRSLIDDMEVDMEVYKSLYKLASVLPHYHSMEVFYGNGVMEFLKFDIESIRSPFTELVEGICNGTIDKV